MVELRLLQAFKHAPFRSNSALATGGALRPAALPRRAWGRKRSGADVDSAKETGARFRGAYLESKASHQRARDQQAHLSSHISSQFVSHLVSHLRSHLCPHIGAEEQKLPRQEGLQAGREETRPAGD